MTGDHIIAWLYELGMPIAIPIAYAPEASRLGVQVIGSSGDDHGERDDYKKWLVKECKKGR
jgi:hypothetical protein